MHDVRVNAAKAVLKRIFIFSDKPKLSPFFPVASNSYGASAFYAFTIARPPSPLLPHQTTPQQICIRGNSAFNQNAAVKLNISRVEVAVNKIYIKEIGGRGQG